MIAKKFKNIISIFDLDILLNDDEILKDFILEIFEICHKIKEETEGKFGIIFLEKGINEYLLLDFKILILALFNFLQKTDIRIENFNNIKKSFPFDDYIILDDSMRNLLFILAKKNLVYFSDLRKYYRKYKLYISNNNFIYSTKFNGIAVKYPTIIKLFSNDKKILSEFEELITRNSEINRNNSNINESFSIDNFSQFNMK